MLSEFDLIQQYFQRPRHPQRATLGIGDDCALLTPSPAMQTAISSDMLVEGRHFFAGEDPYRLGHKAGRQPVRPGRHGRAPGRLHAGAGAAGRRDWLHGFSRGLFALADAFNIELIGGDTTKGPLNICITVFGEVAPGQALRRSAARPATISGFPARWAMPAWRWPATATKWRWTRRLRRRPCACICPCRAWSWACCWPGKASPMRPSIFPMAW
jgi:thiamine-monophosphate kinase